VVYFNILKNIYLEQLKKVSGKLKKVDATKKILNGNLRASISLLIVNSCVEIFYIHPYYFVFLRPGVNFTFIERVTSNLHQLVNEI